MIRGIPMPEILRIAGHELRYYQSLYMILSNTHIANNPSRNVKSPAFVAAYPVSSVGVFEGGPLLDFRNCPLRLIWVPISMMGVMNVVHASCY